MFGLCGIWGFGSFFLYDRRQRAKVRLDEREEKINEQATIIGFAMAWMVFVALCMGVWAFCFFCGASHDVFPLAFWRSGCRWMDLYTVTQAIAYSGAVQAERGRWHPLRWRR